MFVVEHSLAKVAMDVDDSLQSPMSQTVASIWIGAYCVPLAVSLDGLRLWETRDQINPVGRAELTLE